MYMDFTCPPCNVGLSLRIGCPVWDYIPSSLCNEVLSHFFVLSNRMCVEVKPVSSRSGLSCRLGAKEDNVHEGGKI